MSLKDLIASDVTSVFLNTEDFAESATYTPSGGTARSITVVVTDNKTAESQEMYERLSKKELVTFCKLDATTGIDDPHKNDSLEYDGAPWRFESVVSKDNSGISIRWTASQDVSTRGK